MDDTKNNLLDVLSKFPELLVSIYTCSIFYLRYDYSQDAESFYNIPSYYFNESADNNKIIVILVLSFSLVLPLFFDKYLSIKINKVKRNYDIRKFVLIIGLLSFIVMYFYLNFKITCLAVILSIFFYLISSHSLKKENLNKTEEYKNKTYILIIIFLLINFFTFILGREKPKTLKNYELLFKINNSSEVTSNYKKNSYLVKVGEHNDKFIVLSGKVKSKNLILDTSVYGFVNPEEYCVKNVRFNDVEAENKDEK